MKPIVIIGAGGHGRDVLDIFEACNDARAQYDVVGFIVEPAYGAPGTLVSDKPILGGFDWLAVHAGDVECVSAVGAPELRRRLVALATAAGARFCSVVHPSAIVSRRVRFEPGSVVAGGVVLTNGVSIGAHAHVNIAATLAHDVRLGDYAFIAPGAHVSGNVTVGQGAYVGTGASVIEKVSIGAWSVVGAGSAVIRDVAPNTTVVGCPARVVRERPVGWHL